MKNKIIDDYVDDVGRRLRHMKQSDRTAVLREIRDHLETETKRLMDDEAMTRDIAALNATNAFGDAEEISVAYGPGGGVIDRASGKTVLEVAALTGQGITTVGRGLGRILKWTLITVLSVLAIAAAVAITLTVTFQDDIREAIPRPTYSHYEYWGTTEPTSDVVTDSFQIGKNIKEFRVSLHIDREQGCAKVELVPPAGATIAVNGNGCSDHRYLTTFTQQGTWQIRYTYVAYVGGIDVDVLAFEDADA